MLIIAFLNNTQQAVMNYRSRRQLKIASKDTLRDLAITPLEASKEGRKANFFTFFREVFFLRSSSASLSVKKRNIS
ncbi:hypothetical protein CBF23_014130 [Marinomonas agarivorans]|nr:hypothetical protein CBF23_014130 [Marinomonas agarivorans]